MADTDAKLVTAPMPPNPNAGGGSFGKVPEMTNGMTFKEMGSSGLRAFSGYVREEFLPQLQGRQAQTVYREMADNSPVIGGMIFAINATMRKVNWRTVPADDTPDAEEAAEFADTLRDDMSHTWEDCIAEGLSMVPFGFAPLEIVYKRRLGKDPGPDPRRPGKQLPGSKFNDGAIGWRRLPIRGQDTVIKWFFDENGEVEGMTQQPWTGPLLDIPIQKLLLFRPTQHKNNPEGRSVIRNAYRSYFLTKRIEEQEAILYERMNGIPVLRVPSALMEGAQAGDPAAVAALNAFKQIAVNLRVDEQMGLVLPSDTFEGATGPSTAAMYGFELVSPGGGKGGGPDSDKTVTRHQSMMMMSVLADFLMLGHGKTGTQALADNKADMFFQAVEGYLNSMGAVFNNHGLERIWALNGKDPDLMPHYEPDLAQRIDLDVLSNFVLRLSQSGMALFPNNDLQSALMDAAGLPDIADTEAAEFLSEFEGMPPMATVGPLAAAATQVLAPPPPPVIAPPGEDKPPQKDGPPGEQLQKIMMASLARRMMKTALTHRNGVVMDINTMRKRKLPTK